MKINCNFKMTIFRLLLLAVLLLANYALNVLALNQPCGDWEPFKNELCFKVFNATELQTFEKAEKTCQENGATLIRIPNIETQQFLIDFIFNRNKVVDNVWIGAKFAGGKYQWEDKSNLTYSNWTQGNPKNLEGYCVQIQPDIDSLGQWVTEPCTKKNLVVCQKKATLSLSQMEELLFQLKHELKDSLEAVKQEFTKTQKELADTKEELRNSITNTQESLIPIGFVYVQLPKDKAPSEMWPNRMIWKDVSEDYSGVFFRVQGGGAATFGQVQGYQAPRMEQIMSGGLANIDAAMDGYDSPRDVPQSGWSHGYPTGGYDGETIYTKFKFSDNSEVRPVNMAMKVWRRTA